MIFLEFTGAGEDPTHVARLQARSMFKDIRAEAEEYIYKKLVSHGLGHQAELLDMKMFRSVRWTNF